MSESLQQKADEFAGRIGGGDGGEVQARADKLARALSEDKPAREGDDKKRRATSLAQEARRQQGKRDR